MKKVFGLAFMFLAVLSLTGCGGDKVTCTLAEDYEETKMTVTFKNDKITNFLGEMKMTAPEGSSESEMDTAYAMIKMSAAMFEDVKGVKVTPSKGSDYVAMKVEVDLTKADNETLEELNLGISDTSISKEAFIKEMTDNGYTCK